MAATQFRCGLLGILVFCLCWPALCARVQDSGVPFQEASKIVRLGIEAVSSLLNERRGQAMWSMLLNMRKGTGKEPSTETEFLPLLLRTIGMDSNKLADLAFGGIISVVQLVNQILTETERVTTTRTRREQKDFSIFRFLIEQPQVTQLMDRMQEPELVDSFLEEVEPDPGGYIDGGGQCVSVLLCKTAPFVKKMQKSLQFFLKRSSGKESCRQERDTKESECKEDILWDSSGIEERLYFFVPSLAEVVERGQECDQRYPNCSY